ncbi:chorismate mutase [Saccharopolyspora phatthalungensis]|uniref:Chorismate mutase n=1 Tax=Saccharopolyspora phatthalungensis TaxID=664693 RepID=A0A840Q785_9PSEU|nr:chorismate mutase [Saccharopolyspora phatthalungensis]MBB5154568.1 chorismate mutase [Saccharopolyspora phatthalungensis]
MRSLLLACTIVAALAFPAHATGEESLDPLLRSAAERVTTSDQVAAAKWGTGQPIDDPAREQQVLDVVGRKSLDLGIDPDEAKRIFRDQIEASKLVQRALHERWAADPDEQPTERPDLGEIRPVIDRLNNEILQELRDTRQLRERPSCGGRLTSAFHHTRTDLRLGALHQTGLARAIPSICTGP